MTEQRGKTVGLTTLGCKTNQYDTAAMADAFQRAGYTVAPFEEICDVYVINTCMVTGTGENKSMKFVRQAARRNPNAAVIVAGCMAQHGREKLFLPGVRLVLGNARRGEVVQLVEQAIRENTAICAVTEIGQDNTPFEALDINAVEGRSRAVLKIQEGCDNRCTYCIIPTVRGAIRSREMESIRKQAARLGVAGYAEVVVTGIHLASYGREWHNGISLVDALETICLQPGIKRVRLGSLEPIYITPEHAERLAALRDTLCPQFHLSLQSGSDKILQSMKRQYTTARFAKAVQTLRDAFPDCAITTDVICGFPGETEEDFLQTVDFCKQIAFARTHVFPYSERTGTPAASYPNSVPVSEREARARRLIAEARKLEAAYAQSFVGKRVEVLVEKDDMGYTREYVHCRLPQGSAAQPGQIVTLPIVSREGNVLLG